MSNDEDRRFARLAIERKFCTRDQMKECLARLKQPRDEGQNAPSLEALAIEKEFLTTDQAKVLRKALADQIDSNALMPTAQDDKPQFGGYEILKRIDRGAMGTVYKARQVSMDRIVAIKVLSKNLSRDKEFVSRFEREARATARLNHPNIILGIDVGEAEGRRYFVMEFVDGRTVGEYLKRGGAMDEKRALLIVQQIARALDHADGHHLVHRDIKPENIMVTRDGTAKLCDLGLAKATNTDSTQTEAGKSLGTPNYISPEQARGDVDVDIRSDIPLGRRNR